MDVVLTILGSGVVAALATAFAQWLMRQRDENRLRAFSILRVVLVLEGYALKCADVVSEHSLHEDSEGSAGTERGSLPNFPSMPEDVDWKLVSTEHSARALSLPLEVEIANGVISHVWDVTADDVEVGKVCKEQAGRIGWRSWRLAGEMRSCVNLPLADRSRMLWDFPKLLEQFSTAEESRKDRPPPGWPATFSR